MPAGGDGAQAGSGRPSAVGAVDLHPRQVDCRAVHKAHSIKESVASFFPPKRQGAPRFLPGSPSTGGGAEPTKSCEHDKDKGREIEKDKDKENPMRRLDRDAGEGLESQRREREVTPGGEGGGGGQKKGLSAAVPMCACRCGSAASSFSTL